MARLDDLTAARDLMWESIQEAPADKRASLMAQWRALEKDIAELADESTAKAGDPVDEVAARRSARGGATARPRRTAGHPG